MNADTLVVGFFAVLVLVAIAIALWPFRRNIPPAGGLALLAVFLAMPLSAQTPACSGSLGVWSGTQTSTGGSQAVIVGSRAEGGCNVLLGLRAFGRLDAYPLKGKTVNLADPSTFESVASVEGWAGLSYKVAGPFSLAAFGGVQRSLEGGQLGIGGATQSLCAGGRLDYSGGLAIGGLCSRYSPAQTLKDGARIDGPALVGTVVLPVKAHVRLAANGAFLLRTRDYSFTVGPVITVGN